MSEIHDHNQVNAYKIAQIGGLLLFFVMDILMYIGTYSMALFITEGVFAAAGLVTFFAARKAGERRRIQKLDKERRERKTADKET
jgi:hypothetical protein